MKFFQLKFVLRSILLFTLLLATACGTDDNYSTNTSNEDSSDMDVEYIVDIGGDYIAYNSIEELNSASTDVVRIEVLDERVERINILGRTQDQFENFEAYQSFNWVFTVYRLRVIEVFKGDSTVGDIIEAKQLGGQYNHVSYVSSDKIPLAIGDDLVIFVILYGDMPAGLINPTQSAYHFPPIPSMGDESYLGDYVMLESLSLHNDLELTMGDLRIIRAIDNACPYTIPQATINPPHYHDFHGGGSEIMFTITNTGTVPITGLSAHAITTHNPSSPWNEFTMSSPLSTTWLMPGASATVWVTAEHGGGDMEGTLLVTSANGLELSAELVLWCSSWRAEYAITSDDTPPEDDDTQSDSDHYPIDDGSDNELSPTGDDPIEIGNQNEQPHYPNDNGYTTYDNHDNR